jgi:5-formyltetrahydrofolate cyclo-ligase
MSQEQKNKIRKFFLKKRLDFSLDFVKNKSEKICKNATKYIQEQNKIKNIALYYSINNEVDLNYLKNFLEQNNYKIFLPKIIDDQLKFGQFTKNNLTHNSKIPKIIEPKEISNQIMDLIFCPLVTFDKNNNRIGMGGGFYDKLIERYHKNNYQCQFIGIAYQEQFYNDIIPIEKFDQKLDLIIKY